jgi:hypothetical protein
MVGGDDKKELDRLKSIIGKKIVSVEIWGMDYSKNKWVKNHKEGNITIILNDGTCLQGVDGEYGTNTIEKISKKVRK